MSRGRIFSQAGNKLEASSFPARNKLSMLFPYTSFPAGNELLLKLTKNTASAVLVVNCKKIINHICLSGESLFVTSCVLNT